MILYIISQPLFVHIKHKWIFTADVAVVVAVVVLVLLIVKNEQRLKSHVSD